MKKTVLAVMLLRLSVGFLLPGQTGGGYVDAILVVPESYRYAKVVPEMNVRYQWWFETDRVAVKTSGWQLHFMDTDFQLILNRKTKRLTIVNLKEKTFVIADLEKKPLVYAPDNYMAGLSNVFYHASYQKSMSNEHKKLLNRNAEQYDWHIKLKEGTLKARERIRRVWVSTELPFDPQLYNDALRWIRTFANLHTDYFKKLSEMKGFVMKSEETIYSRGSKKHWRFTVKKISKQPAPATVFSIPEGFKIKEKLSDNDLWLLKCVFLYPRILQ